MQCTGCSWDGPEASLASHSRAAHPYETSSKEINDNAIYKGCPQCGGEHGHSSCPQNLNNQKVEVSWQPILCIRCNRHLPLFIHQERQTFLCAECLQPKTRNLSKDEAIDFLRKGGRWEDICNKIQTD